MSEKVAIVDFGLGNLFSVRQACEHAGMDVVITDRPKDLERASAVILPGVGAFADAMGTLKKLDLISPLRDVAASGKPLVGICLGLQLLMDEGFEFGHHQGLGIIAGEVVPMEGPRDGKRTLKVPHVGWNQVLPAQDGGWDETLLRGLPPEVMMYFVHSFHVRPADPGVEVCRARYGDYEFCCGVRRSQVEAYQFHPERSGPQGLAVYANLAERLGCSPCRG